jgi:RND family efflux transporter MFP subunit
MFGFINRIIFQWVNRLFWVFLGLSAGLSLALPVWAAETAPAAAVRATVSVQTLRVQSLAPSIPVYGQVIADPTHTQSLATQTGGLVSRVLVEAGQRVKKGQPLLMLQTDPNANLAFEQAVSQRVVLEQDLTQKRYLFARQMATQQDVVSAEQALKAAAQRVKTLAQIGSNQATQTLAATEDGLVIAVPVQVGSMVAPGGSLLSLSAQQAMLLRFGVEPEDAARIEPGMAVTFHSVFAPKSQASASVVRVDGQINPATRLLDVMAQPADRQARFIAGTTLQGEIILPAMQGLTVPIDAVVQAGSALGVFRLADRGAADKTTDSKAIWVPIKLLLRVGQAALVAPVTAGALHEGDEIVTQGQYVLQDGMAVRVVPEQAAAGQAAVGVPN